MASVEPPLAPLNPRPGVSRMKTTAKKKNGNRQKSTRKTKPPVSRSNKNSEMKNLEDIAKYVDEWIQSYKDYTPDMREQDGRDPYIDGWHDGSAAAIANVKDAMPGKTVKEILVYVDRKAIDADVEADETGYAYQGGFLDGTRSALVDLEYWIRTGVREYSLKIPMVRT